MTTRASILRNDESASVGIGTLIVFIATVLVAAVAAGVLIKVSADLQSRASSTGNDATADISSNIVVESVDGDRWCGDGGANDIDTDGNGVADASGPVTCTSGNDIRFLVVSIRLAAGSSPIDMTSTVLQFDDTTAVYRLSRGTTAAALTPLETGYQFTSVVAEYLTRTAGSTVAASDSLLDTGELMELLIRYDSNGNLGSTEDIAPNQSINLLVIPSIGGEASISFTTPPAFGADRWVTLF